MIYFFDAQGRCFYKSSEVRSAYLDRAALARQRQLHGAAARFECISLIDYELHQIYWEAGRLKQRQTNPTQPAGQTLTNVPNPSTVTVGNTSVTVNDGTVVLDLPYAGSYLVKVESWPYFDANFTVTVP